MKTCLYGLSICMYFFITGCIKYHLSTQSFLYQMANSHIATRSTINVNLLQYNHDVKYLGNNLEEIKVLTKSNKEVKISLARHARLIIFKKDGTKSEFLFETVMIRDSMIMGAGSHPEPFLNSVNSVSPIKLVEIEKIEIINKIYLKNFPARSTKRK